MSSIRNVCQSSIFWKVLPIASLIATGPAVSCSARFIAGKHRLYRFRIAAINQASRILNIWEVTLTVPGRVLCSCISAKEATQRLLFTRASGVRRRSREQRCFRQKQRCYVGHHRRSELFFNKIIPRASGARENLPNGAEQQLCSNNRVAGME